jgi:cobalt-zinc-cadmium efflux system outer membrane protein
MKTFIAPIFVTISMFCTTIIAAQETVTPDQLIEEALKNNPEIQAARDRHLAAEARPGQMRSLPDPIVSVVSRNGSGSPIPFTQLGKDPLSSVGVMWEQEIPYPGKLRLAAQIAQSEADSAKADIDKVRWMVIGKVKEAYFEYVRADKSIRILGDSLGLLKHFEEIARARYSVGESIQQDVLRAQVELSILEQRITSLEQERATAIAAINRLLNRNVAAELPRPADVTLTSLVAPFDALMTQYALDAPEVRSAEAMVQRERQALDLAKKQYRPDFMTSAEYANSPDFPDMWEIQFGLRIPLFYKSKQAKGVAEATHNLARAERELQSIRQETAFKIRNQYLQIQASEKLFKLYNQAVLPQSNLTLEASLATYQVGKSDFLTTLTNFRTVLDYRVNYFEELAKHETAIAQLEQVLGRPVALDVRRAGGINP